MLPSDLEQIVSAPMPTSHFQQSTGIGWLDLGRLTPVEVEGQPLSPPHLRRLVYALFGASNESTASVLVAKKRIHSNALDVLAAEIVQQAAAGCENNGPNRVEFFSPSLYDAAGRVGSHRTASAIRDAVIRCEMNAHEGLKALLALEGAQAIGFCAGRIRYLLPYFTREVEQAIDRTCAEAGISPQERALRSLPDDPAKKKSAVEALQALFEGGFAWNERTFRGCLLEHSMLLDLARTLVWGELAGNGSAQRLFRILSDRTAVDAAGSQVSPRFPIVIAHPAQVDAADIAPWKELWAREKLRPPFRQWERDDVNGGEISLPAHTVAPSELLAGLESRGWKRGRVESGALRHHSKDFPHQKSTAYVRYTGVPVTYGGTWGPQAIEAIYFRSGDAPRPAEEVGRLVIAAVNADIQAVFGKDGNR